MKQGKDYEKQREEEVRKAKRKGKKNIFGTKCVSLLSTNFCVKKHFAPINIHRLLEVQAKLFENNRFIRTQKLIYSASAQDVSAPTVHLQVGKNGRINTQFRM